MYNNLMVRPAESLFSMFAFIKNKIAQEVIEHIHVPLSVRVISMLKSGLFIANQNVRTRYLKCLNRGCKKAIRMNSLLEL